MRLLTWNTHSLHGEDLEGALTVACRVCARYLPDVIALQEVNQSRSAPLFSGALPKGYRFCQDQVLLRQDHYGLALLESLAAVGLFYDWSWLPVKLGYGKYDEGLMILSRRPLAEVRAIPLSEDRPFEDWRRRMALLARLGGEKEWFVNLHTSWWQDREEPFDRQFRRLLDGLPREGRIWLMGDFNNPAHLRGEGYDLVAESGFFDCFRLSRMRDGEETVRGGIDGWQGRLEATAGARIDQIWCNHPVSVASYRTLLDGRESPMVSDHFGVFVETEER